MPGISKSVCGELAVFIPPFPTVRLSGRMGHPALFRMNNEAVRALLEGNYF
jgi:hypothetical protein